MKRTILVVAMIFAAFAVFAQKKESLALFPFTGGNASDGTAIVSSLARQAVLRNAFNKTTLVTRNTIAAMNFEQRFQRNSGLTDADTIFELGKQLNHSHVIAGYITKLGDRNLVIVSIMDVESLQQIAGDYRAYSTIEEIDALIPAIAQKLAAAVPKNTNALPGLSVPPFNIASGVNQNDAMVLAQILSCDLANSGKYAVLPRTDSLDKIMEEQRRQRSGVTDQERIKRLGAGRNAQLVLSGSVQRLGSLNKFAVDILDIVDGSFIDGHEEQYTNLSQGFELIPKLAEQVAKNAWPIDFEMKGTTLVKYKGSAANVTIPTGVTAIGEYAFDECTSLTSVTIPNSVTSIAKGAFIRCTSLSSISIPVGVTSIGEYAFTGCTRLASISIPNSVTSIGSWAFNDCTGLTSITIPNSVSSIGECAFMGCARLASITIPNNVTSIDELTFGYCTSLTSVTFAAGNRLATIGENAFIGCTRLASISIPAGVTSIGENAFNGCTRLASINIPNSVTSIGKSAFFNWTPSQTINVQGKANQSAADAAWGAGWRSACDAKINYSR